MTDMYVYEYIRAWIKITKFHYEIDKSVVPYSYIVCYVRAIQPGTYEIMRKI